MHSSIAPDVDLDRFIEAFEAAHQTPAAGGPPVLDEFLPPPGHPLFLGVLAELVCVDLDYGWARGVPTSLDEYRRRFPALFTDPAATRAVVWEDYRQRRQANEDPDPEDYRRRYGVSPVLAEPVANGDGPPTQVVAEAGAVAPPMVGSDNRWADRLDLLGNGRRAGAAEVYQATHRTDPAAAERYAQLMAGLPQVGEVFAGFRLEAELGHGAFGRVFLARQADLADRAVALKVSAELFGEAQTMARLHHTNIVEIYSRHQVGPVQAVCMPYEGGTTLADVFRALRGSKSLPASGKQLVSTLQGRKQPTTPDGPSPKVAGTQARDTKHETREKPGSCPADAPTTEALAALERYSYPEAVLWLGMKLADGLAYAHERGIIHRDLKPANVLLTDLGQPMLIDFNLADNSTLRTTEAGSRVGGTLPYMAPEQLRAFQKTGDRRPDARTDIYSLGLILFELLTGKMAYSMPSERGPAGLAQMLTERSAPPPRLRAINPAVTPAEEAIIRRCLEPDPDQRYQTARELHDDIARHLRHEPLKHTPEPSVRERLRKWRHRHPKLTSGTSVGVLAAVVLSVVGAGAFMLHREIQRRDAADGLQDLMTTTDKAKSRLIRSLDAESRMAATDAARQAVAAYGVFDRADWQSGPLVTALPPAEQDRLRGRVGEVLFLLAQSALDEKADDPARLRTALAFNDRAALCFAADSRPKSWWEQRTTLLDKLGEADAAARAADEAKRTDVRTTADRYLLALRLYDEGRHAEALPPLTQATRDDPRHFWAWFLRGNCHYFLGQQTEAARCYSVCISLDQHQARPYFNRARVMHRLRDFTQAIADSDRAAQLDPASVEAGIEMALSRFRQALALARPAHLPTTRDELLQKAGVGLPLDQKKLLAEAEDQLSTILRKPDPPLRCYFYRADVRLALGDKAGASADVKEGFAREPAADDDLSWIIRGLKRKAREPEKALADFRRAEAINPHSFSALQNQSHVLMEANRHEENLAVLNRLLERYPELAEARAGRAVQLARLGRSAEARADAEWVLSHSADPFLTYQVAGVYAHTGDSREALRLLAKALIHGFGFQELAIDPDLNPIRESPEFLKLKDAVRTLQTFLGPQPAVGVGRN